MRSGHSGRLSEPLQPLQRSGSSRNIDSSTTAAVRACFSGSSVRWDTRTVTDTISIRRSRSSETRRRCARRPRLHPCPGSARARRIHAKRCGNWTRISGLAATSDRDAECRRHQAETASRLLESAAPAVSPPHLQSEDAGVARRRALWESVQFYDRPFFDTKAFMLNSRALVSYPAIHGRHSRRAVSRPRQPAPPVLVAVVHVFAKFGYWFSPKADMAVMYFKNRRPAARP